MAASDQTYRNQKMLDVVFGVSCLLMLASVVLLFWQDYSRPWKKVQRQFRDVDEAVTQRQLLAEIGNHLALPEAADKAADDVKTARDGLAEARKNAEADVRDKQATRDRLGAKAAALKADRDSFQSLYDIAVDERARDPQRTDLAGTVQERFNRLQQLNKDYGEADRQLQEAERAVKDAQAPIRAGQERVDQAEDSLKKLRDPKTHDTAVGNLDILAKALAQKGFHTGDLVRALPVVDGFASPYKIKQITLEDYPIDYSFKRVTRYDRCTTCHLGMEQDKFSKDALGRISTDDAGDNAQEVLDGLRKLYEKRKKNGESIGFDPSDLPKKVLTVKLTDGQVNQFAAHPRLELFVDANSPHPIEKFGCTSCHSGQGSSTDFENASHTPASTPQREGWVKEHGWEPTHGGDWEYPMLSSRFIESTCVKCHHEITDLITHGSKEEAPKLLRGYNLVRESGCFGCHEIAGIKSGVQIGPDLRLEPPVPLDSPYLRPAEREKLLSDPLNPPGTLRKVGPSLYRLSEKTNQDWVRKWVASPRGFRPTTKMPHFYGQLNNAHDNLEKAQDEETKKQADFPTAEIYGIAYYLESESRNYLEGKDLYRRTLQQRLADLQKKKESLTDAEKKELIELPKKIADHEGAPNLALRMTPRPLFALPHGQANEGTPDPKTGLILHLTDAEGTETPLPPEVGGAERDGHLVEGARLFREKGCLACHRHSGTEKDLSDARGPIPAVESKATFAPDLSRLAKKLGADLPEIADAARREAAQTQVKRLWLVQWILNPNQHHPRTRMPITHLDANQAAAVADWLLSQEVADWPNDKDKEVARLDKEPSLQQLAALARVSLMKATDLTMDDVDATLKPRGADQLQGIPASKDKIKWDADERRLQKDGITADDLKWYIGRKAINRQGCFGCHEVPGFETAKPIGTALNDWGKKDPERLAFEDAPAYVHNTYHFVPEKGMRDEKGHGPKVEEGKEPFEEYFREALEHHQRDGFLHLKLLDPRSYDYNRIRAWDDRLRMPQFKFARGTATQLKGESAGQAEERAEAEARESVMTFILGLVAEPVPGKYLNRPPDDRLAEAKGRQVLDKYNCAGCHEVRPGTYEFKTTPRSDDVVRKELARRLRQFAPPDAGPDNPYRTDHVVENHNAWVGRPSKGDRVLAHGDNPLLLGAGAKQQLYLRLEQALHFVAPEKKADGKSEEMNIRAYSGPVGIPSGQLILPPDTDRLLLAEGKVPPQLLPYGGTFADMMTDYLARRDSTNYPISGTDESRDTSKPRSALPPSLSREGERVQPAWLHGFLRNPTPIRPENWMLLRMPKFNFSDDEVTALVSYFSANERLENPGIGVTYPYQSATQRDPNYIRERNAEYVKRILEQKDGKKLLEDRWTEQVKKYLIPDVEAQVAAAEHDQKAEDPKVKEEATKKLEAARKRLGDLKAEVDRKPDSPKNADRAKWEGEEIYFNDAFRMVAHQDTCLQCHQVGNIPLKDPPKGPRLTLAAERLRPDWTEHWIGNPPRLLYSIMPVQFPKDDQPGNMTPPGGGYKSFFIGSSDEQVRAVRDILMNFQAVADMPGNRSYRPAPGGK